MYRLTAFIQNLQLQLQSFRLTEVFCNTDTFKYSFILSTSSQWNQLPRHMILDSDTVNLFKSKLRNYYYAINS